MKNVAKVSRTRNKQFRVKYYGANGEMLASSEALTTRANVNKNIVAMVKLSGGQFIDVRDMSGKEPARYTLDRSGKRIDANF